MRLLLLHIVIILLLHGLIAGGVFGFSVSGGYQNQYQYYQCWYAYQLVHQAVVCIVW